MTGFEQSESFLIGRAGEHKVVEFLQSRGWNVIPSYDYAGQDRDKAPRLQGRSLKIAIPDLDICQRGTRCWIEVKTKARADFTRMTGEQEHGFSARLCGNYRTVETESGTPVYVVVLETETSALLCASLIFLLRAPLWPAFIEPPPRTALPPAIE